MVPESFPGVLKTNTTNKNKPLLPKHSRRFTLEGMSEFEHFIKTLLSKVQPKRTRCKRLRGQWPISKCFTASDKAFALIVPDNKLHMWDEQIEKRKRLSCMKSDLRMEKKHMKQQGSGGKCGWLKEGQKICKRLTNKMVAQRKTGWREQEERKQPALMMTHFLANTEDTGNDSNSETRFGGEDAFEDC